VSGWDVVLGSALGFTSGVLSGLFGVGGAIVTTPGVQHLLGAAPIEAVATPLPIILPTSLVGAYTYARTGEIDRRAAAWVIAPGVVGTVAGALLTDLVDAHALLLVTAFLIGWSAVGVIRSRTAPPVEARAVSGWGYGAVGLVAGTVSGLLGVGGGIVMVPAFTALFGMPLKRALGTSLLCIAALVVPGTLTHWLLGHIDWAIFLVVTLGAVPGARLGARLALGTREPVLRLMVGTLLLGVAAVYGVSELAELLSGRG
jgi:uncharacterized membrane protein YfcA